ncbi:integrase arm-type DNA-binding domain-containing protein [Escherichia coli]
MPLNDMQIRRAKPEDKPYTLGDGQGLSLLIEPNGSKSWRFRYRYAGKPKMISLGVYPTITLADARSRRDEARKLVAEGKNPSEVRKEQKMALQTESENAFEKIAREWHQLKSAKWSAGYASDIMEAFKNDIFPYVGTRPVGEIKPLELLNVLRKIEKRGALEKMRRPHLVPLSTQALDLLHELKIMTGNYRYVFPGRNNPNKPMSEASVNQLIKRIGYSGKLSGHGFRHMMSTILHENGFNSEWIEAQLAHLDKNTIRGIYNHAVYFEQRKKMLSFYADYIFRMS